MSNPNMINKGIKKLSKHLIILANNFLGFLEPYFYPKKTPQKLNPIFIIGAPRSGSTLLYQVLTHRYKFIYLNNFTVDKMVTEFKKVYWAIDAINKKIITSDK